MELDILACGDSFELIKKIPDKSVDLIITDPPYKIDGVHTGTGILKDRTGKGLGHYVNQMMEKKLDKSFDIERMCQEWVRVMKKVNIYIWCNKEQIMDYMNFFVGKMNCTFEFIIWYKTNVPPFTNGHYLKDKEYCILFRDKGVKLYGNYSTMNTVYVGTVNKADKKKWKHPTIKPQEYLENFIYNSSVEGDVVLDTFMGSGSTCAAAKAMGRHYIGFELDKEFYDIANKRIEDVIEGESVERYCKDYVVEDNDETDNFQLSIFDFDEE